MRLKDYLKGLLTDEELMLVPSSYDIIGSRQKAVVIIELPEELGDKRLLVAEVLMKIHKNVKSVLVKKSARKGVYRLRDLEVILGEKDTEVIHVEYGYKLKLDPTKVYFSPRESTERQRIAKQVKEGEVVMVMFAGVGPYAFAILKAQPLVKKIIAIEINPQAYQYLVENIKLNKAEGKIIPVLGDVREKAKDFYGTCDRVVMPLPKGAHEFLEEAFRSLRDEGGVIHIYHWAPENDLYSEIEEKIRRKAAELNYQVKIISRRKVLPYAPRIYKICVDFWAKKV